MNGSTKLEESDLWHRREILILNLLHEIKELQKRVRIKEIKDILDSIDDITEEILDAQKDLDEESEYDAYARLNFSQFWDAK